jgi:hypothetical protein
MDTAARPQRGRQQEQWLWVPELGIWKSHGMINYTLRIDTAIPQSCCFECSQRLLSMYLDMLSAAGSGIRAPGLGRSPRPVLCPVPERRGVGLRRKPDKKVGPLHDGYIFKSRVNFGGHQRCPEVLRGPFPAIMALPR